MRPAGPGTRRKRPAGSQLVHGAACRAGARLPSWLRAAATNKNSPPARWLEGHANPQQLPLQGRRVPDTSNPPKPVDNNASGPAEMLTAQQVLLRWRLGAP